MENYDKELGLRELVLQELSEIVDDLQIQSEANPKLIHNEDNKYCILLTICLERCITFGMKESGFFKQRDLFEFLSKGSVNAKDVYLRQDFQSVQQLLLNPAGKARAWIRKTINESHLATSLYALASDREFIRSWFEPFAIMSSNTINDLATAAEKLEELHFQFNLRDRVLDHDDLFALFRSLFCSLCISIQYRWLSIWDQTAFAVPGTAQIEAAPETETEKEAG